MMDSHETKLSANSEELDENKVTVAETAETQSESEALAEKQVEALPRFATAKEVVDYLKAKTEDVDNTRKQELDVLKLVFYKLRNEELGKNEQKTDGTDTEQNEEHKAEEDALELEFKEVMSAIREKKASRSIAQEKEKEENLKIKLEIIEKLKALVESPENANKSYNEFKKLQQQWNDIKLIPQAQANELWKNYQLYVEKFYDILKLNNEFREYDFKKNLETKLHLCEAAEKLTTEEDVISAFHQLQKLHQDFRTTGPVAKELREEVWARFKAASTIVNKRHQQHFEELKEAEQYNLDQKTVICEIVEGIEYDELKTFLAWENKTKEILALQSKWKTIGFAPQKMNVKIFERFRHACDEFFRKKGEFFKILKGSMNSNLEKKKELCEKAEALKDSTDWKATAEIFVKLQKDWKTIGPVSKKHSDAVWNRFITACDYFFEKKGQATSAQKVVEQDNLKKKKEIINKLSELLNAEDVDNAEKEVKELMSEWNSVGHVPFKEKDKIYTSYRAAVDKIFEKHNINSSNKELNSFSSNINSLSDAQAVYREREKLTRVYENIKNELQTYENNIGFLTSSSKKGNSLVSEMNRKVEKLKADLDLVSQKIKVIEDSIKTEE
jgi:hypothetical protein